MTATRLTRDDDLALAAEESLTELILNARDLPGITDAGDGGPVEANVIETYKEAMLLTGDRGLVVELSDGRQIRLTITAYAPARKVRQR